MNMLLMLQVNMLLLGKMACRRGSWGGRHGRRGDHMRGRVDGRLGGQDLKILDFASCDAERAQYSSSRFFGILDHNWIEI